MYSKQVLTHFKNPHNVGTIEDPDGKGKAGGGPKCPDDLAYVWIRVEGGRIVEIKHKTQGCPFAIASSSVTTQLAEGKTVQEALQMEKEAVAEALGEIPERKLDSIVAPQALKKAIRDFQAKKVSDRK